MISDGNMRGASEILVIAIQACPDNWCVPFSLNWPGGNLTSVWFSRGMLPTVYLVCQMACLRAFVTVIVTPHILEIYKDIYIYSNTPYTGNIIYIYDYVRHPFHLRSKDQQELLCLNCSCVLSVPLFNRPGNPSRQTCSGKIVAFGRESAHHLHWGVSNKNRGH